MKNILLIMSVITILIGCTSEVHRSAKMYFNVPSIIGKNIDQTRKILNIEEQVDPVDDSITTWDDYYDVEQHIMMIHYNPQTRKVTEIDIVYPDGYPTKEDMLKVGNLSSNCMEYSSEVEPDSWAFDGNIYKSVKVRFYE